MLHAMVGQSVVQLSQPVTGTNTSFPMARGVVTGQVYKSDRLSKNTRMPAELLKSMNGGPWSVVDIYS